jgi:hypothetical protein
VSVRPWGLLATAGAAALALVCSSSPVRAQASAVPADIQAELIAKLETYDRNFAARAGPVAHVLIVVRPGSSKSELSAADTRAALGRIDKLGGLPHQESVVPYAGADALAARCRSEQAAVVYVTPGFDDDVEAMRSALASVSVLTVGSTADYVPRGIVLGFELESGKPKIVINLEQAKAQSVNFPADLLRLMKVYR